MSEQINLGCCCCCGEAEAVGIMLLSKRTPYGWGWGCFQCGQPEEGAIAVVCEDCGEAEAPLQWFVKGEPLLGDRAPYAELESAPDFEHNLALHPELQYQDDDPVVLVDEATGESLTESQLNEIIASASAKAAAGMVPPYWRNEQSGRLQPAIEALINYGAKPGGSYPPPTPQQLGLIIQYFQLHINAPCWVDCGELAELRAQAQTLQTFEDCDRWLLKAINLGIDPL